MASLHNDILDAIVTRLTALGLTYQDPDLGQTHVPIRKRKVPGVEEELDTLPLVCAAPDRGGFTREPASFEGHYYATYRFELSLVSRGNMEPVAGLDQTLDWQQQIIRGFPDAGALSTIREVWDLEVTEGVVIDPGEVNAAYDYGGVTVEVKTCETRS